MPDQDSRSEHANDPLRFEALLAELTARFVNLPAHEVHAQISASLEQLGQFLGVDRSSFAQFSEEKPDMIVAHCYAAPGIQPFPPVVVEENLPWYAAQIRRGEPVCYARLPDDLPPEAVAEREYCLRHGLKSNLAIPLRAGGLLNCVLTFATFHRYREWPDELVRRLWLVGEIFANSLLRMRIEEKTQRLQEQLTRLVRITLVGELAAAIAHEVNQPLCAIVSNAQAAQRLLAVERPDLDEVRETLQDIAADSRRANAVVAHIRAMLQKQTPERSSLQLADAVREVAALVYGPAMQKGVSVALQLAPDLPQVYGDRVQLQQVVLNLALNALDAMNQPEVVTRQLSVQARRERDDRVMVSVSDTGPGIAPQHHEEVFQAFFTTKPTGLGVGLAISRSIVESHGGRLWVESELGGGSQFHFTLPSIEEAKA